MSKILLQELSDAVINCDEEKVKEISKKILEQRIDPYKVITDTLTPAISEFGKRFEKGEVFLPQLIMAADAMNAAVNILKKGMSKEKLEAIKKGTIVLGTVKGDIHSIGKDIVGIMLRTAAYEVIDLGVDVEPSKFMDEAEKSNADIIAASALMTYTASNMKVITDYLEMEGVRNKYKLIFGGGPLNERWAKEMGADAYAQDAINAVDVVDQLMRK